MHQDFFDCPFLSDTADVGDLFLASAGEQTVIIRYVNSK